MRYEILWSSRARSLNIFVITNIKHSVWCHLRKKFVTVIIPRSQGRNGPSANICGCTLALRKRRSIGRISKGRKDQLTVVMLRSLDHYLFVLRMVKLSPHDSLCSLNDWSIDYRADRSIRYIKLQVSKCIQRFTTSNIFVERRYFDMINMCSVGFFALRIFTIPNWDPRSTIEPH